MDIKPPSPDISTEQWNMWLKKRRHTSIGYLMVAVVCGVDYNFMLTTLYLYLRDSIKVDRPRLWYGIIFGVFSISSAVFSAIIGRLVDKTRRMRFYVLGSLFIQVVGCIVYAIPWNVYYPIIGRVVAGFGDTFMSVVTGEAMRIYDSDGGTKFLMWLGACFTIGAITGPMVVLPFKGVDFWIGKLHVTQLNIISLVISFFIFITLVIVYFLIHDCSREINLKAILYENGEKHKNDDVRNIIPAEEDSHPLLENMEEDDRFTTPIGTIIHRLFHNVDAVLMFVASFVFSYCVFATDVLFPLLVLQVLEWNLTTMSLLATLMGIIFFIMMAVTSNFDLTDKRVYNSAVVCIVSMDLMFVAMIGIKLTHRNLTTDIILMVFLMPTYILTWVIDEVLMKSIMSQMVPSHMNSFVEGLRNGWAKSARIVASFSAPLLLPFLSYWACTLIFIVTVILILFILRRKSFTKIVPMEFKD